MRLVEQPGRGVAEVTAEQLGDQGLVRDVGDTDHEHAVVGNDLLLPQRGQEVLRANQMLEHVGEDDHVIGLVRQHRSPARLEQVDLERLGQAGVARLGKGL